MIKQNTLARYLEPLLRGDRKSCRTVIEETLQSGIPANAVYVHLVWPVMVEIEKLLRDDKVTPVQEHLATRVNRTIVDQLQNKLPRRASRARRVVICCASDESGELGGQMVADLFESDGWEARFLGGSVSNDDIIAYIGNFRPEVLILYGVRARCAPQVRRLIDTIRAINACPGMRIMLSGGVFGNAEGLWEEIGADMYACNASEAVRLACGELQEPVKPQRMIKQRRKKVQPEASPEAAAEPATVGA